MADVEPGPPMGKYHRHFGDNVIHLDLGCDNPATRRPVVVFDEDSFVVVSDRIAADAKAELVKELGDRFDRCRCDITVDPACEIHLPLLGPPTVGADR